MGSNALRPFTPHTWVRREDGPKLGAHADAEAKAAQPPPLRRLARVCHEGADWRPKFDDVVQRLRRPGGPEVRVSLCGGEGPAVQ
eukprot:305270-Chlamydomonas_euryale.AAC.1